MVLQINENEYKIKYTIRGLFIYEQLTGTTFNPDRLLNEYTLMYALLVANNDGLNMTFDEFIQCCDDNASIFQTFRKWLITELKQQALLMGAEESKKEEKPKKKD